MNSLGRCRSAKLGRRREVCRPVRIVEKDVSDDGKSLPEQVISLPKARVMLRVGVVRPEANDPHLVKGAGFGTKLTTSVQKVAFHREI